MNNTRNPKIDILKGLAIFFVCWGHSIQIFGEKVDILLLDCTLGRFIYLVHMPLFFFLSGYVAEKSISKSMLQLIGDKFVKLFLPIVSIFLIGFVLYCYRCDLDLTPMGYAAEGLDRFLHMYWFIYVLFYCFVVMKLVTCLSRRPLALIISIPLIWILPHMSIIPYFSYLKSMYPFFVAGNIFHSKGLLDRVSSNNIVLIACLIIYVAAIAFTRQNDFMYFLTLDVYDDISVVISEYRRLAVLIVAGMAGIILSYRLIDYVKGRALASVLQNVGRHTLQIYILSDFLFFKILYYNLDFYRYDGIFSQLVFFIIGVLITGICYAVSYYSRNNIFNTILFCKKPLPA